MMSAWLVRLAWLFRDRPQLLVRREKEVPARDTLTAGEAVLVGSPRVPKWLSVPCPCGCGVPYLLSLSRSRRPRWDVATDWLARPTVTPSVRRLDGCRSHFWIRKGEIAWCYDSGKPAIDDDN